jgi:hypothetical protein
MILVVRILSTTLKQKKTINKEEELFHHIPDVLIKKIPNLKNVQHKEELKRFVRDYKERPFKDMIEEYEVVKTSISNLVRQFFTDSLPRVIERDMKASLAGQIIEEEVRESFIHPFQIFLLGSIIIDRFYDKFTRWYDGELGISKENSIEAAWLLASIFHDRAKNVNILRKMLELEIGKFEDKIPDEDAYIGLLSSFYNHRSKNKPSSTWNVASPKNSTIEKILLEFSEKWNHGVKSSVLMLRNIHPNPSEVLPRDIISAFAIAVHDKELWDRLLAKGIFPLRMDLFPLTCLLVQLDAIQEWGRRAVVDTHTRLVGINITGKSVTCELAFESPLALENKIKECHKAGQCVFSQNLEISLDLRIKARLSK